MVLITQEEDHGLLCQEFTIFTATNLNNKNKSSCAVEPQLLINQRRRRAAEVRRSFVEVCENKGRSSVGHESLTHDLN